MKSQNEKNGCSKRRLMLGIAATCLLALISLPACTTSRRAPPTMVEGADYHWATNNGERVMFLTKTGFVKITQLKIDWGAKR